MNGSIHNESPIPMYFVILNWWLQTNLPFLWNNRLYGVTNFSYNFIPADNLLKCKWLEKRSLHANEFGFFKLNANESNIHFVLLINESE